MSVIDDAPRARRSEVSWAGSVAILAWPDQVDEAAACARVAQPRLLLVASDADPPADWDGLTDWIRLPVDQRDLCARVAALQRLASRRAPAPVLDEHDVLWRGEHWLALSPIEARIVEVLLDRCGEVVARDVLASAAWPDAPPRSRAVDAHVRKLRSRVEPLGLRVHRVRGHGLMLELDDLSA